MFPCIDKPAGPSREVKEIYMKELSPNRVAESTAGEQKGEDLPGGGREAEKEAWMWWLGKKVMGMWWIEGDHKVTRRLPGDMLRRRDAA